MIRWIRRILGLIAFGFAIGWTLEAIVAWRRRPRYGVDEGRPTGLRVSALSPDETALARAVEREFFRGARERTLTAPTGRAHSSETVTARPGS